MSKRYPGGIIRKTPQTPSQTSAQGIWDMASVTQAVKENTWPIAGVPDPISRSLRFRASASAYLNRTFGTPTNNKLFTWSGWVKRSQIGVWNDLFGAGGSDGFGFNTVWNDNGLAFFTNNASGDYFFLVTTQVFRDPSAWYHIVLAVDTTQATASNRAKIYVNGVQITAFNSAVYQSQNSSLTYNSATTHYLGSLNGSIRYFDGYMTEVYFIDGQALTPSSFGTTDDQTGVWEPIAYTGTYGTNGFYLPFSNTASTSTLGNDFSGNSNNWTTNNISLTSGSTYDSMVDVPTQWIPYNTAGDTGALYRGNYCTLNPLAKDSDVTISNGNLNFDCTSAGLGGVIGTIAVSSGKWYWEVVTTSGVLGAAVGIAKLPLTAYDANQTGTYLYLNGGNKRLSPSTDSAYGASYTTNDVIGVALDMDAGTVTFYKNNTSQGTAFSSLSGDFTAWVQDGSSGEATVLNINFGQRPFAYAPPSGFVTLNTRNLPTPTIGTTSTTQAVDYFDATTYTGTGSSQLISNAGSFQPNFVWIKQRSAAGQHNLMDVLRAGFRLRTDDTAAESDCSTLFSFASTGFNVLTSNPSYNQNTGTYVAWQWKASDSGVSNTAGSITSTVSANTTAGFSIVTYTGNGTGSATVGHGLGATPSMVIVKRRSAASDWPVSSRSISAGQILVLNSSNAVSTDNGPFASTYPSSTVITLGTSTDTNANTATYVAYCFSQVAGYSAFGSYVGNGSSDGPFIFTGFKPKFILTKNITTAGYWWEMVDSARSPYNTSNVTLYANVSDSEYTSSTYNKDLVSNGFKIRGTSAAQNSSGDTFIYMAFAESPFKYALAR